MGGPLVLPKPAGTGVLARRLRGLLATPPGVLPTAARCDSSSAQASLSSNLKALLTSFAAAAAARGVSTGAVDVNKAVISERVLCAPSATPETTEETRERCETLLEVEAEEPRCTAGKTMMSGLRGKLVMLMEPAELDCGLPSAACSTSPAVAVVAGDVAVDCDAVGAALVSSDCLISLPALEP